MIEKNLLKQLPVEFQEIKPSKKKMADKGKSTISIKFLQTDAAQPDHFYRPISKYLNFNDK